MAHEKSIARLTSKRVLLIERCFLQRKVKLFLTAIMVAIEANEKEAEL